MYAGRVTCSLLVSHVQYRREQVVRCVAQWLERWSLTGELSCTTLDLQLTVDH